MDEFEVHRDAPDPERLGVVTPGPVIHEDSDDLGPFPCELAFQLIGRHVGWQPGEVRRDMTFSFELGQVKYQIHVTTDDGPYEDELHPDELD